MYGSLMCTHAEWLRKQSEWVMTIFNRNHGSRNRNTCVSYTLFTLGMSMLLTMSKIDCRLRTESTRFKIDAICCWNAVSSAWFWVMRWKKENELRDRNGLQDCYPFDWQQDGFAMFSNAMEMRQIKESKVNRHKVRQYCMPLTCK